MTRDKKRQITSEQRSCDRLQLIGLSALLTLTQRNVHTTRPGEDSSSTGKREKKNFCAPHVSGQLNCLFCFAFVQRETILWSEVCMGFFIGSEVCKRFYFPYRKVDDAQTQAGQKALNVELLLCLHSQGQKLPSTKTPFLPRYVCRCTAMSQTHLKQRLTTTVEVVNGSSC